MRNGEWKHFVYLPTFGFSEVIVGEIRETEHNKSKAQYKKTLRDQTLLNRLQKEYPGCTISQDGDLWKIKPEEEK